MSEAQLKAFLSLVAHDSDLANRLREATALDSTLELLKASGFELTVEEFKLARQQVSEEQLEGVSGGGFFSNCAWDGCSW